MKNSISKNPLKYCAFPTNTCDISQQHMCCWGCENFAYISFPLNYLTDS